MSVNYFFLVIMVLCVHNSINSMSRYRDTKFLKKYLHVRGALKKEGFKEIYFHTPDALKLNALFLSRANARYNVIVCAGWLPGRMEGMATFFSLLPQDCNILLFDARGRGKSEGSLLGKVWRYGVDEYKDIVGALDCLKQINNEPTFLCGICSGAFNAARTLIELKKRDMHNTYNVKGLIFDSGWGSVLTIASTIIVSGTEARLLSYFRMITKRCTKMQRAFAYVHESLMAFVKVSYGVMFHGFFKYLMLPYQKDTNIFSSIHMISCPILFIHSRDDSYAKCKDITPLIASVFRKKVWIVDDSYHAKNHLIHHEKYQHALTSFFDECMSE
jgi:pimeloyl-ACP methyl ester carboxylesterase